VRSAPGRRRRPRRTRLLDPTRHTIIYLPNPTVGVRGIHHQIVAALGARPLTHHATCVPQIADALAVEQVERGCTPVVVLDEAHS
jgi:type II secretory pathway predicted ATPase ExeA